MHDKQGKLIIICEITNELVNWYMCEIVFHCLYV